MPRRPTAHGPRRFWRYVKEADAVPMWSALGGYWSTGSTDKRSRPRADVARRPVEVWRGGQVARGSSEERRREAHTVMLDVARGPLLLSLGLGVAGGILWWIQRAGFWVSLADVGEHVDVHYDDEGITVGMEKATSKQPLP
uniref:Uncharacterized protein n=1 Tax=Leersia perrieri TaxID=77586 RepID=A0A0D9VTF7_9ORYZ